MYTVQEYLDILKLAKRSPNTIANYRKILLDYSRFVNVPLEEVHNQLSPQNLIKYAASLTGSERSRNVYLSVLHRYFTLNGVKFDPLETNVINVRSTEEHHDNPLDVLTIRKMMDYASPQMKAAIATLISTGMRPGELCKITIRDLNNDTITIRNEIAKGKKGGKVYLNQEAQEYVNLWLTYRDEYIKGVSTRHFSNVKDDQRVFGLSYVAFRAAFNKLYKKAEGDRGKYWYKITPHSCRKYFRTHAVMTMPLDLVEKLMRHSGYLTDAYVRISDEEARTMFHAGEQSLYITQIGSLKRELDEVKEDQEKRIAFLELVIKEMRQT